MKKTILLYIGIILSMLASCQQESPIELSKSNGKECTLSFKVNIPESQIYSRNEFNNGTNITIDNLYLLVFDEHGVLQAKYQATKTLANEGNEGSTTYDSYSATGIVQGTEYYYRVNVVPRSEKTIIHFIANCPVSYANIPLNKSESELIQSLTTEDEKTAYWQRMVLDYLGEDGSDEDKVVDNLPTVYLIRNFAAVQVKEDDGLNFLKAYDLVNIPQKGTVAPALFTSETGFADYLQTVSEGSNLYKELTDDGYHGAEPQGNTYTPSIAELPDNIDNTSELYLYERNHQGVGDKDITFLIVKGYYNDNVANNGDDIWYYRVDFAENFEYLNILRNFRYIITIKSVTGKGYSTPEDAANGNSVNNIDVDIEVERISDGTNYLFVTPTAITVLNQENKTITFDYETNEESVTCPFTPASEYSGAFTEVTPNSDGTISVKMKYYSGEVPNGKQNQTFKVKTPSGLYREVKVTLIDGFEFQDVTFTQNNEGNYEYSFTIPAGLEKSMFPLELFLFEESCSFSPLGDAMSVKLVDILDENGQKTGRQNWGYSATLDWEDYNATYGSTYTYQFVANSPITTDKTMTVSNEYAKQDGTATYTPPTTITITGNNIVDNTLTWYVGDNASSKSVIVTVNSETVDYNWEALTNFNVEKSSDGKTLTITPINNAISDGKLVDIEDETLVLETTDDDKATAELVLSIVDLPLEITDASLTSPIALGTNKEVTLTFKMNKLATITLNATRLTYASSSTRTITTNDDGTITIRYTPDATGNQTITFKTADAVRGGTVTISYDDKEIPLSYNRTSIGNKDVSGGPKQSIEDMQINMNDIPIGSCRYSKSSKKLQNIRFDYDGKDFITDITEITITGTLDKKTYTIRTNVGNLINGSNLQFSN